MLILLAKKLKAFGNILMIIALTLYVIADMICKQFLFDSPAAQVTFFRTVSRFIPIIISCLLLHHNPVKTTRLNEHLLRGVIASANTFMFMCAYKYAPMTDVHAIGYTSAFFMLPFSFLILNEKISTNSIIAAFVGLIGTMIILKPNLNQVNFANVGGAFALTGAILAALNSVFIRKLSSTEHVLTIIFYHNSILLIFSFLLCCNSWQSITDYKLFISGFFWIGIISAISQYLISYAFSITKSSDLAATNYITIIPVILIDFFMWGNVPSCTVVTGMILIIMCNYMVIKRQNNE